MIGFLVAAEFLLGRIPLQLALELEGDVAEVANADRAMPDLDVADRPFAAADAVEEVAHVIVRDVEPRGATGQRFQQDKVVAGANVAAVHEHPARDVRLALLFDRLPGEQDAVLAAAHADDLRAVGIAVGDLEVAWMVIAVGPLLRLVAHRFDLDRPALVHAQAPLGNVVVMSAPVRHLAARVCLPPAELIVDALLDVILLGRLAQPEIIIQLGRRALHLERSALWVFTNPRLDEQLLAQAAVANDFAGQPEVQVRALLAADLEDALGLPCHLEQGLALVDGQGERLLAIHVLAAPQGGDGGQRVPVVGRGDDHGVDVLAGAKLAEVAVTGDLVLVLLLRHFGDAFQVLLVDVAAGHDAKRLVPLDVVEQPALEAVAGADDADLNRIIGPDLLVPDRSLIRLLG